MNEVELCKDRHLTDRSNRLLRPVCREAAMSTARSTVIDSDHRLASSIQFVFSQEKQATPREAPNKHSLPLTKLVDSMSTSDDRTDSRESITYLQKSSGDIAKSFSFLDVVSNKLTLLACWRTLNAIHQHSSVVCDALSLPQPNRLCLNQCIWCCKFEVDGSKPVPRCKVEDISSVGCGEDMTIVQRVCERCRVRLIDRIRQNMFT